MLPNSIEGLIALGAFIGLIMGWFSKGPKMSIAFMLAFPVLTFLLGIAEFELKYTDNASSTASLVILFIPMFMCVGAVGGWAAGFFLRRLIKH